MKNHTLTLPQILVVMLVAAQILLLPLMMGQRTPETLTASGLALIAGAVLMAVSAWAVPGRGMSLPGCGWLTFAAVLTGLVLLQVWPSVNLAKWLGAYPEALWSHEDFQPRHWSPNPHATLRAWATFVALFTVAWMMSAMPRRGRAVIWLTLVAMAWFQVLYGLLAHAAGAETIFGIWQRHTPDHVHGSFSNRNLYAAWLVLAWPLSVAIWWMRDVPLLSRLPRELAIAGSFLSGAAIGVAVLGSASRLGAAAGLFAMFLALVLWTRLRGMVHGTVIAPVVLAVIGMLIGAVWYGLTPLAERLLETGYENRLEVWAIMLSELPARLYVTGVGLGGFEAVFKLIQPSGITGWFDYAHNDLLQWVLETGLVGIALLVWVVVAVAQGARLNIERVAVYAGLAGLCLVGLGDFSWHIPATQVVSAAFLGTVLRRRHGHTHHDHSDARVVK